MPRGRPRKSNSTLPPSYVLSHGAVYHVANNKWRRIGTQAQAHADYVSRSRQSSRPLDPLIDAVLDQLKARKARPLAENTKRQYTEAAYLLKSMLRAKANLREVRPMDAVQIRTLLRDRPGIANRVLSFARVVFAQFLEEQRIEFNPFLGVKGYPKAQRDRLYTQDEWNRIYAQADARLQCIMDGLFLTDQRVDDVIGIDERNIHDEGAGIYFKQQKTGKALIVAWNPQLRDWVARCRELHGTVVAIEIKDRPRYLFRARGANRPAYKTILENWSRAVERAGVENAQMRDVRAYSATEAERQGLNAQKLLGHTDAKTTRIYLRGREVEIVQGPQMLRTA